MMKKPHSAIPFLFSLTLLLSFQSTAQVIQCGGLFSSVPADYKCQEVKAFGMPNVVGGSPVRLFRFEKDWENRPDDLATLDQIAESAMKAMNYYSKLGSLPPIEILFSNEFGAQAGNAAEAKFGSRPCRITVFYSFDQDPDGAKQAFAHEIFHCFQGQTMFAPRDYATKHSSAWWIEGTADYFSNLVFPKTNREAQFQVLYASSIPLTQQSSPYSVSLFFQYLENIGQASPATIFAEINKHPQTNNPIGTLEELSKWPMIEQNFHGFARALVEKNIQDTGGGLAGIPGVPSFHLIDLDPEGKKITFSVAPFAITTLALAMPKGAKIEIRLDDIMQARGLRVSYRKRGDSGWLNLKKETPLKIETQCQDEKNAVYEFIFTSTEPNGGMASPMELTQNVEVMQCACLAPTAIIDPCLSGQWILDNIMTGVAVRDYFRAQTVGDLRFLKDVTYTGGTFVNMKSGESKTKVHHQNSEILNFWELIENPSKVNVVGLNINAEISATLMQDDKNKLCLRYDTLDGIYQTIMNSSRRTVPNSSIITHEFVPMKYKCTDKELWVWVGDLPLWVLVRP
jgi:hypothetical protein